MRHYTSYLYGHPEIIELFEAAFDKLIEIESHDDLFSNVEERNNLYIGLQLFVLNLRNISEQKLIEIGRVINNKLEKDEYKKLKTSISFSRYLWDTNRKLQKSSLPFNSLLRLV